MLDQWIADVEAELGIDSPLIIADLLRMTGVVAHAVERPAAPLTAFLVGYAAALDGGGQEALAEADRRVCALAERWAREHANTPEES